ncbi:MAG: hypothetical protein IPJ79_13350 [Bacteroidetes bacterium]|nr:hypothetical protein [Bacteroidota bacterium]
MPILLTLTPGLIQLTLPGGFIAKYDSTGLFQWAVRTAYNSYNTLSITVNATGYMLPVALTARLILTITCCSKPYSKLG